MPARRVTTVTLPVDGRSGVAFEPYRDRTPLLTGSSQNAAGSRSETHVANVSPKPHAQVTHQPTPQRGRLLAGQAECQCGTVGGAGHR